MDEIRKVRKREIKMDKSFDDATRMLDKAESEPNIINAVDYYFEGLEMLLDEIENHNFDYDLKKYHNKFQTYKNQLQMRCFGLLNQEIVLKKSEINSIWRVYCFLKEIDFFSDVETQKQLLFKLYDVDKKLNFDENNKRVSEAINFERSLHVEYSAGDKVLVIDGPFASFHGIIKLVKKEQQEISVTVSIFGRKSLVDLKYLEVEKI